MRGSKVKAFCQVAKTLTAKVENDYNVKLFQKEVETNQVDLEGKKKVIKLTVGTVKLTPDSPKAILKSLKRGHHA